MVAADARGLARHRCRVRRWCGMGDGRNNVADTFSIGPGRLRRCQPHTGCDHGGLRYAAAIDWLPDLGEGTRESPIVAPTVVRVYPIVYRIWPTEERSN